MLTPEVLSGREVTRGLVAHTVAGVGDTVHAARILGDWLISIPEATAARPAVALVRQTLDLGGEPDPEDGGVVWRASHDVAEQIVAALAAGDDSQLAALALAALPSSNTNRKATS